MSDQGRRLSVEEAAQLIYQTPRPTEVHLDKVRDKLVRGVLQGSAQGWWVASDSVAAYMASRTVASQLQAIDKKASAQESGDMAEIAGRRPSSLSGRPQSRELPRVYRLGLRDYFAAVINRRRPDQATAAFDRAVLAGQIAFVVLPIMIAIVGYARLTVPAPEQGIVQQWLKQHHKEFLVVEWFPPRPRPSEPGTSIQVKYRYLTDSRKAIVTDRTFIVHDGQATPAPTRDD